MVRLATEKDIDRILEIYDMAKHFMHTNGNPTQWNGKYPERELILDDIQKEHFFVIVDEEDDKVCGCFALIDGDDPTYEYIEGEWKSYEPYATIHRIASSGTRKGIFSECVSFARGKYDHLRVDTHEDNKPMQRVVSENGFEYAGIIYIGDGTPRKAYEWKGERSK